MSGCSASPSCGRRSTRRTSPSARRSERPRPRPPSDGRSGTRPTPSCARSVRTASDCSSPTARRTCGRATATSRRRASRRAAARAAGGVRRSDRERGLMRRAGSLALAACVLAVAACTASARRSRVRPPWCCSTSRTARVAEHVRARYDRTFAIVLEHLREAGGRPRCRHHRQQPDGARRAPDQRDVRALHDHATTPSTAGRSTTSRSGRCATSRARSWRTRAAARTSSARSRSPSSSSRRTRRRASAPLVLLSDMVQSANGMHLGSVEDVVAGAGLRAPRGRADDRPHRRARVRRRRGRDDDLRPHPDPDRGDRVVLDGVVRTVGRERRVLRREPRALPDRGGRGVNIGEPKRTIEIEPVVRAGPGGAAGRGARARAHARTHPRARAREGADRARTEPGLADGPAPFPPRAARARARDRAGHRMAHVASRPRREGRRHPRVADAGLPVGPDGADPRPVSPGASARTERRPDRAGAGSTRRRASNVSRRPGPP